MNDKQAIAQELDQDIDLSAIDPLNVSEAEEEAPASPTALKLDRWGMRKGEEVRDRSKALRDEFVEADKRNNPFDALNTYVPDSLTPDDERHTTADFFGAAFESTPELSEKCEDPRRREYLEQLMQTEQYQLLHLETKRDEYASELATVALTKEWLALREKEPPKDPSESKQQCLQAAGDAVKQASDDVDGLRSMQQSLGVGSGGSVPLADMRKLWGKVRNSRKLKRICDLAGRYRRFAQARQRAKVTHGRDDVMGIELGNDLGSILPHELASLSDPDLELDTMRRLVERQLMQREYQGIEKQGSGPICVVVDESGSMDRDRIANAKAISLALAWIARSQKRYCCLVSFGCSSESKYCVLPVDWQADDLMEWLEHFFCGGTSYEVPFVEVPRKWEKLGCPKGKTDMILITDGCFRIPPNAKRNYLKWKEDEQVKLVSLVLDHDPGQLNEVSDSLYLLDALSLEEEGVAQVLST